MGGISLDQLAHALETIVGGFGAGVQNAFTVLKQKLDSVFGGIIASLAEIVTPLQNFLARLVGSIEADLSSTLNLTEALLGEVADFARQIPARLGDFAAALTAKLGELPEDTIKAASEGLPHFLLQVLLFLLEHGDEAFKDLVGDRLKDAADQLARATNAAAKGGFGLEGFLPHGSPPDVDDPLALVAYSIIAFIGVFWAVAEGAGGPFRRDVEQAVNEITPNAIISPELAARLYRTEQIDPATAQTLAKAGGYDAEQFGNLIAGTEEPLPPGQVIDLWNRNQRPTGYLEKALARAGVRRDDIALMAQLADYIPPVSDVLTFLTRDNFNAEIVAEFGQEQEFGQNYEAGKKLFEQLGISQETAMEYWKAHWQLPSLEFGYRMFQRTGGSEHGQGRTLPSGATVNSWISHETLQRLHRAHGIEPFWREAFLNIAFNPLTRIDVRRLRKVGLLDKDGVARAYMDLGYNDHNAALLADYVETLTKGDDVAERHAIRAPIEGHVLATYRKHYIDRAEASALLEGLDYTPTQITHLLASADLEIARDYATEAESAIKAVYVRGDLTAEEATAKLAGYGFKAEPIGHLLGIWDIARAERALTQEQSQHRALSRAEILEAYTDRVLTRDQAGALLVHATHSPDEAATMLALADARLAKAETRDLIDGVRARYVAGKISPSQAAGELDGLQVAPRRRNALLGSWDLERLKRESRLTTNQVEAMLNQSIISPAQAATELRQAGYGDQEIGWLLRLWGAA